MSEPTTPKTSKARAILKIICSYFLLILSLAGKLLAWLWQAFSALWRHLRDKPAGKGSLRLRLSIFFAFFLAVAWLCAAFFSWKECRDYVDEFFDTQQVLFAKRMASSNLENTPLWMPEKSKSTPGFSKKNMGELDDEALAFAIFNNNGVLVQSDGENGRYFIYPGFTRGFINGPIAGSKKSWRVIWMNSSDGKHVVAVGQQLDYRREMALELLDEQIVPWLVLLPVLLLGLVLLLTRELAPLRQMTAQLQTRKPEDATLLDVRSIPREVRPLAEALNSLFTRTSELLKRERAFISDASHELRTPLAGLRVQAQVASEAVDDSELRNAALANLQEGIDRSARLVEQLLAISRLETFAADKANDGLTGMGLAVLDWPALLEEVLSVYQPRAEEKNISVSCEQSTSITPTQGYPNLISLLLRNLAENAVHYTPEGGKILIRLGEKSIVFENSCEKIPDEYAAKLGERFFRPPGQEQPGSGLGLSIVKRIAEIHKFDLKIEPLAHTQASPGSTFKASIFW